MSNYIDVIVPRGGKGLISKVQKFSNIHVIGHLEGLCHIFIDKRNDELELESQPVISCIIKLLSFI